MTDERRIRPDGVSASGYWAAVVITAGGYQDLAENGLGPVLHHHREDAEEWILLHADAYKSRGDTLALRFVLSEHWHFESADGVSDFCDGVDDEFKDGDSFQSWDAIHYEDLCNAYCGDVTDSSLE